MLIRVLLFVSRIFFDKYLCGPPLLSDDCDRNYGVLTSMLASLRI